MEQFAPPASELSKIGVASFPTAGQGLALDQTGKIPPGVGTILVRNKDSTSVDVQNTVTETSVSYSNVVAGSMGAVGALRLTIWGDYLHNNVAGDTVALRVKFGGTTFWANTSNIGALIGAARHPWVLTLLLSNTGATNSQVLFGTIVTERPDDPAPTTGIGEGLTGVGNFVNQTIGSSGLGTIDTTVDQPLTVTVQWSAASGNNSWRKRYSLLELF